MSLKALTLNLEVGQEIMIGSNNKATITKIEFHEKSGEVSLNTTRGPRKALTFKLCEQEKEFSNPADKYRQMKILDITNESDSAVVDEKASRELCKSSTPNSALGASNLASCKSQGFRRREGNKSHKLGPKSSSRVKVGGKKIKGKKYGGPLPDYGSGS